MEVEEENGFLLSSDESEEEGKEDTDNKEYGKSKDIDQLTAGHMGQQIHDISRHVKNHTRFMMNCSSWQARKRRYVSCIMRRNPMEVEENGFLLSSDESVEEGEEDTNNEE
ncbi:hypothetical protein S83_010880 [Arachis hypogaea]